MTTTRAEKPLVSISIVSHGNAAEISALLESILRFELGEKLQLILTANLGKDLPEVEESRWHSVTLIRNEHPRGFASNHNAAFRKAAADIFCIINPDVVLLEPVFTRLLDNLQAGKVHILTPLAVDAEGCVQDTFRSLPTPLELFGRRVFGTKKASPFSKEQLFHPDWIAGTFQVMPSAVYAELGGMDEGFRMYLEDVDFCTRARLAGYSIGVDPTLRFQHAGRRASRSDLKHLIWHTSSALRFFTSPVYRRARRPGH